MMPLFPLSEPFLPLAWNPPTSLPFLVSHWLPSCITVRANAPARCWSILHSRNQWVLLSYESEGCFVMSAVALPDLSGAGEGSEGLCEPSSSALPPQMPSSYRFLQHQAWGLALAKCPILANLGPTDQAGPPSSARQRCLDSSENRDIQGPSMWGEKREE